MNIYFAMKEICYGRLTKISGTIEMSNLNLLYYKIHVLSLTCFISCTFEYG